MSENGTVTLRISNAQRCKKVEQNKLIIQSTFKKVEQNKLIIQSTFKKVEQNNADIHYVLNPNYFYLLNNQ